MSDERRIDRMAGCSCLGKGMLTVGAVLLAAFLLLNLDRCFYATDRSSHFLDVKSVIVDLEMAFVSYEADFHRLPVQENGLATEDVSTRSRGTLLQVLRGENVSMLNPREIKYAEFPMAKNRKHGLWQDGNEWVLSDRWGEPYYIALDTNGDGKIANPQSGAEHQPATLPLKVLIYSSGPDRDPKTWEDNVCSWRVR